MIGDGNGDNGRRGKRSEGGGGKTKKEFNQKSIEKRTQDLIERNSPSVRPSILLQLEQSRAEQSKAM